MSNRVLNMFWVQFFEIFFCPVFHKGRIFENSQKNQKLFKIGKKPKINHKSVQTCFEYVLGYLFRIFFCPVFHGGSNLRKFSKKIKNISKIHKSPKSFPKMSKPVLNMFLGNYFENCFCPVFHGESSLRKFSKKSKTFQNCKKARNRSQNCPNVF